MVVSGLKHVLTRFLLNLVHSKLMRSFKIFTIILQDFFKGIIRSYKILTRDKCLIRLPYKTRISYKFKK